MPVCRFHHQWPCLPCTVKNYTICKAENEVRREKGEPKDENGNLLLHDVDGLAKSIMEMGGVVPS